MYTHKRFRTPKSAVAIIPIALALVAWGILVPNLLAEKPEDKGATKIAFEVDLVDLVECDVTYNSPTLISTCPGVTGEWNLKSATTRYAKWPKGSQCIVIKPLGSTYKLTDDPQFYPGRRGGKIVSVTFVIQDVFGPDGIVHSTESIPITPPVVPSSSGFILHVHADNVPVWRHKGNQRVEQIGTISIADVVFRPLEPQSAPPAPHLRSGLTSTWGRIKADREQ